MAKLTGAKKKAFLERMARGRKKAARGTKHAHKPKRNPAAKKKAAAKKKNGPKRKPAAKRKNGGKLTGARKAEFLKRMARGRKKAARNGAGHKKAPARKNGRGNGRRRRNSEADDAAAMYETFHQRPPGHIVDYEQAYQYPTHFAELGELLELHVYLDRANPDFKLSQFKGAQCVCTPDGSNIYFLGGDQALDLDAMGVSSDKDFIELGPCNYICYFTVKGFHDFEPTKYEHKFGEDSGVFPRLTYDRLNHTLFLVGGEYQVRRPGIVN